MANKIERVLARQQEKIAEGQFYEVHQQFRVIASRYIKAAQWSQAIELLSSGAQLLLKAGQGGSGGDLGVMLLEVYNKSETASDAQSKAKLLSVLRAFPQNEPTKKKFVNEMMGWSAKHGEFPAGDPELHHVAGTLYAEEDEPYEAERHLILGTKDSPDQLINLEYAWYSEDETHTAPIYAARAVLPYLLVGNLRAANRSLQLFTARLSASHPGMPVSQHVSSSSSDLDVYPSLPLLNFLSLLLLAIQRGEAGLFRLLKTHFAAHIKELDGAWDEALAQIGEMYFGIRIPSQTNPLFEMMGSMFMGGGKKAGSGASKPKGIAGPGPAAPGVD